MGQNLSENIEKRKKIEEGTKKFLIFTCKQNKLVPELAMQSHCLPKLSIKIAT